LFLAFVIAPGPVLVLERGDDGGRRQAPAVVSV